MWGKYNEKGKTALGVERWRKNFNDKVHTIIDTGDRLPERFSATCCLIYKHRVCRIKVKIWETLWKKKGARGEVGTFELVMVV